MNACATTMGKFEDFLGTVLGGYARKGYVSGIGKFEELYGTSIAKLVKSPDATEMIKFFVVGI